MRQSYLALLEATVLVIAAGLLRPSPARAVNPAASPRLAITAVADTGNYPSDNQQCVAEIAHVDIGGFRVLTILRDLQPVLSINDVTGIVWVPGNRLVYSVSGLFGDPGLYVFDCKRGRSRIIVSRGEYYELLGATSGKDPTLLFFYSGDVATKTSDAVYQVRMDGTGLSLAGQSR